MVDAEYEKQRIAYEAEAEEIQEYNREVMAKFQKERRKLMDEFKEKNKDVLANMSKYRADATTLYRNFQMSGFGVYNCDRRLEIANPKVIAHSDIKLITNKKAEYYSLYVLDFTNNTMISYYPNVPIKYDADSRTALLFFDKEGKSIGAISADEFELATLRPKNKIELNVLAAKNTSIGKLSKMLASN